MMAVFWLGLAMWAIGVGWLVIAAWLVARFRRAWRAGQKRPWGNLAFACFFVFIAAGHINFALGPLPPVVPGWWRMICGAAAGPIAVVLLMTFVGMPWTDPADG